MTFNLFVEYHERTQAQKGKDSIGTGWEDVFTNTLSFYLSCDSKALNEFCRFVLSEEDYEEPRSVETQVVISEGRPDLVIHLKSGSQLRIECKVDAALQPDQLQRYLKDNTYVALFAKNTMNISPDVIKNIKYKRPQNGQHYYWSDLYNILPRADDNDIGISNMRFFFRVYLEHIGFAPSSLDENWYRLYEDRTIEDNAKAQKTFGQKLRATKDWLNNHDFKVTSVSYSGLQAVPKSGTMKDAHVYFVVIGPERSRKDLLPREVNENLNNEVLRLALVYNSIGIPESTWKIYKTFPCPFKDQQGHLWWPTKPYKFSNSRVRLEFVSNLNVFLENETDIDKNIKNSCVEVIDMITSIINNISPNQWQEGFVDRSKDHFELRYGLSNTGGWDDWLPVALIGPPTKGAFIVQFLNDDKISKISANVFQQVKKEIEFYLIEKKEEDPWAYAQYHCGTAANAYSAIHWSFFLAKSNLKESTR
ncbi:MAG: hypothetical protein BWY69_01592 [Planctomycetes bacterium ADurb.Bin401]|nr:MAG: hypothetical protein BWY69_01592 [Planctomycetes bacterium ADurb.Bin401]HNY51673.1 hypothetical protein [Smithella sp.]HOG91615.1 hypothetical protein [Smithella sp.]HQO15039.1 hypothetical protein [Smithellaceae bacterium]